MLSKEELQKEITEITDLLYQQKVKEGYEKIPALVNDLSVYISTIEDTTRQEEILETLNEALSAMQQADVTLLSDLLLYELLEKL